MMPTVADLGRAMKKKNPGAYDDLADDAVGRAMQRKHPNSYSDFTDSTAATPASMPLENPQEIQAQPQASRAGQFPFPQGLDQAGIQQLTTGIQDLPRQWTAQLPSLLAAAGTPLGPPGIIAGGGTGRALQQVIGPSVGLEAPKSLPEGYLQQAQSAMTQGLLNQVPQELGTAARAVGQAMMQTSLGKLGARGARTAGTAIANRIGPGLRRMGTAQAAKVVGDATARVEAMLLEAKKKGMWHETSDIVTGGKGMVTSKTTLPMANKINRWNEELLTDASGKRGLKIDPVTLNEIRKDLDAEAKPLFEAGKKFGAGPIGRARTLRMQWAKATADHIRKMLHDPEVSPSAIPGLGTEQGRLSMAMDLRDALAPVEARGASKVLPYAHGLGALGGAYWLTHHIDNPYLRAAAMGGLAYGLSPFGMSQAALAMTSPGLVPAATIAARAAAPIADVATSQPKP